MAGLDPRIHAECEHANLFREALNQLTSAWIAGSSPAMTKWKIIPATRSAPEFCKSVSQNSRNEREWSAERRQGRGHATRTDVTTRSRFGRGARHRTIRLREPPASGARRLPALHR
ncbi:MAG: hypothetical protein ABSC37_15320, partial [Xanthobacteraceae bacterium]